MPQATPGGEGVVEEEISENEEEIRKRMLKKLEIFAIIFTPDLLSLSYSEVLTRK